MDSQKEYGWKQPSEYSATDFPALKRLDSDHTASSFEYVKKDIEEFPFTVKDVAAEQLHSEPQQKSWLTRIFIIVLLCMGPLAIIYRQEIMDFVRSIADRATELGKLTYVYYILIFFATVPLCMSVDIMIISASFIFSHMHGQYVGIALASSLSFIAYFITMLLCFLLSRYIFKASVERYLHRYKHYKAVIRATEKEGLYMVVMIRLSPFFPPAIVSYIFGTTNINTFEYCIASFAAMPSIIFFSYVGSLVEGLSNKEAPPRSSMEITLCVVGAVAVTIFAVYYTYMVTNRHLEVKNPQLSDDPETPPPGGAKGMD